MDGGVGGVEGAQVCCDHFNTMLALYFSLNLNHAPAPFNHHPPSLSSFPCLVIACALNGLQPRLVVLLGGAGLHPIGTEDRGPHRAPMGGRGNTVNGEAVGSVIPTTSSYTEDPPSSMPMVD